MSEPWNILTASDRVLWDHSARPPKPKLANDAPPELIEFVKEHREAVLCAAGDRYLRTPPDGWHGPKRSTERYERPQRDRLTDYAHHQGEYNPEVRRWLIDAAARHGSGVLRRRAIQFLAACELIEWQFAHKPDPLQFILDLDDSENPKPQPKESK